MREMRIILHLHFTKQSLGKKITLNKDLNSKVLTTILKSHFDIPETEHSKIILVSKKSKKEYSFEEFIRDKPYKYHGYFELKVRVSEKQVLIPDNISTTTPNFFHNNSPMDPNHSLSFRMFEHSSGKSKEIDIVPAFEWSEKLQQVCQDRKLPVLVLKSPHLADIISSIKKMGHLPSETALMFKLSGPTHKILAISQTGTVLELDGSDSDVCSLIYSHFSSTDPSMMIEQSLLSQDSKEIIKELFSGNLISSKEKLKQVLSLCEVASSFCKYLFGQYKRDIITLEALS